MATQDLTLYEPQHVSMVVRPLVNPAEARQAIQEYEALKAAIVQPGDVQKIQGRDFLKKSFWRRVATCFGVSLELVSEERGFDEGKHLYYSVLYRAVAPNGRTMIGDGYCSTAEPGRGAWPEHNVRATAHTRAKNRAISDLVGGGEVSAEEMQDYVDSTPPPPPTRPTRPAQASVRPAVTESRPVVTPQIVEDRARIDAEPNAEIPITYTIEESPTATDVDGLLRITLGRQIASLRSSLGLSQEHYEGVVASCETKSNDELLAKLQELGDLKREVGLPAKEYQAILARHRTYSALLAKLQELADAKRDGWPLDRPAQKAQ